MATINFPTSVDVFDKFSDPDISSLSLIAQYKNYILANNLAAANAILEANPSLKRMQMNATNLNQILTSIENIEQFFLDEVQDYLVNIVSHKGAWNSATKYTIYNVVEYIIDGGVQSYMGIVTSIPIGTLPTNLNYFTCLTMRGAQGVSGTGLAPRGVWASTIPYYKDDCVSYDNALWQATADSINANPNLAPTYWIRLMDLSKQLMFKDSEPMSTHQSVDDIWIKIIDADKNEYALYRKSADGSYVIMNIGAENVLMPDGVSVATAIDSLNQKASSTTYSATILSTSWSASAPYAQTVSVVGVLPTDNPIIDVVLSGATEADLSVLESWGMISRITTDLNTVIITCLEDVPTVDVNIQIKVVR